ncbi:MAG: hypothetical protein JSW28_06550 [Thermoplasmata archaeon]|nr:MAG: hypothetical protein JSW28_06550 [Thermoplasmata archaeon]
MDLGGHLLITGYGTLDSLSPLVDLVGSTTFGPGESYYGFKVKEDTNPIMNGIYGHFNFGSKFTPLSSDFNSAEANTSVGAQTVAEYDNGEDMIIYRTLPSQGTVTYWNDNGYVDWMGDSDYEVMFKNYVDRHLYGIQVHDLLVNEVIYPVFSFHGETHQIGATLINRGTSDETGIYVDFYENWNLTEQREVNSLGSWDSTQLTFTWTAPMGADGVYDLIIYVNWMMGETMVLNNYVRGKVYVGSTPMPGTVALISDNNELEGIAYILEEMGLNYDILSQNHQRGSKNNYIINYTEDMALLFKYQTIVLHKDFRTITQYERDAFMAYTRNGGSLLVTGPFWVSGTNLYDKLLAEVLGLRADDGQLYFGSAFLVNASNHPMMKGPYGSFAKDHVVSGLTPLVFGA